MTSPASAPITSSLPPSINSQPVTAPPPAIGSIPPTIVIAPVSGFVPSNSTASFLAAASPDEPALLLKMKCEKRCGAEVDKACNCGVGDEKCNNAGCRCDTSCACKSTNLGNMPEKPGKVASSLSGKPIDNQSANPVECADGSCKLPKPTDPTDTGPATAGKGLGREHKTSEEHKQDQGPLSGTCDGSQEHASLVVWQPGQGSPHSKIAEQEGKKPANKEELEPCKHLNEDVHKQEEHQKLCSPLPQGDKLKAILFDIDGTIADSDPIHFLAFQEVLAEEGYNGGVPISHEFFIRQMSGKLNYVIAEELMPEMDEKKRITMMDEKEARYRKLAGKDLQPIPGFVEFAEYVKKRGLRRAAVTNSPRLNAEQVIAALKIPDFFEIVVVGSECDNPKPYPDPYLKAIKFLGVEPNQCFVLEDSPSGIKAGRAAGSPVVGLLTGHPGPVLRDNGASVLIQDYHDSALWIALGEEACAGDACSQSHDSTPSTGVPPPMPVSA